MKKNRFFRILALIILSIVIFLGCARSCDTIDLNQLFKIFNKNQSGERFTFVDTKPPVIKLRGPESISIELGTKWKEPGYKAIDNVDGNITNRVVIDGVVNTSILGKYKIVYNVKDRAGNEAAAKIRIIDVIKKNTNF